jgi:hypothetical protein
MITGHVDLNFSDGVRYSSLVGDIWIKSIMFFQSIISYKNGKDTMDMVSVSKHTKSPT